MRWTHTSWRSLTRPLLASAVVHALSLMALAYVILPEEVKELLLIHQHDPFAGQQVVVELSIARPAAELPPAPELPPVESPVIITPAGAQFRQHVYVDKTTEEVMQEPPAMRQVPAEVTVPRPAKPTAAEDSPASTATPPARASTPTGQLARTQRRVEVSTPSVAAVPQALGTRSRTSPTMSNNRPPRYPESAKRSGWEGTVLLKLKIDAAGAVTGVEIVRSSGHSILDAEAVNAVRQWRGEPATENGKPVASEEYLPVRFRL